MSNYLFELRSYGAWCRHDAADDPPMWVVSDTDTSGGQHDYNPACSRCWFGHSHSQELHVHNVANNPPGETP